MICLVYMYLHNIFINILLLPNDIYYQLLNHFPGPISQIRLDLLNNIIVTPIDHEYNDLETGNSNTFSKKQQMFILNRQTTVHNLRL